MTQEQQEQVCAWVMLAFAIIVLIFGLWITKPTEEDITACQESTGWSYETCKHKLSI